MKLLLAFLCTTAFVGCADDRGSADQRPMSEHSTSGVPGDPHADTTHYHPMTDDTGQYHNSNAGQVTTDPNTMQHH